MGTEVLSKIQKPKQRPSNQDILSAARSACCRLSLETSIEAKFGVLPRRIYLKAAKLCGEHGVKVQWHLKGYICSNGSMEASDNGLEVDECHCIMEAHHFSKRGFGKTTVLCSDISFGKEPVPISCVVDEENLLIREKPWESFTYKVQHWCGCRGLVCSPLTCDHVYLFGNDFEEARDVYRKSMSCSANLVTHQVVVESMESLLAHIGLYASTDIAAGEEITRDYERKPVTSGQENEHSCHCRATNCRNHFSSSRS
ncbi:hypothetical protein F2Q69_00026849 [Brassica cretica]|uniref:Post-SET domain-containing protein n=1 Tax=Brassica cretica TaxID=69181 RepID=A0A8S9S0L2_BRACR|nr:hypothetical protein F2Q69_00026849 [Brassica cretica]